MRGLLHSLAHGLAVAQPIKPAACTRDSSWRLIPIMIVNRSSSFQLIVNVSMLWVGLR
jgi:hypothetical protein